MFINNASLRLREFALVLAVALLIPYITAFGYWFGLPEPDPAWSTIRILSNITFEASSLAVLAYVLFRQKRSWSDIGVTFTNLDIVYSFALAIVAYLAYVIVYVLAQTISNALTGRPVVVQPNNISIIKSGGFVILLLYMIINPFFEEIIVRAFTMTELFAFTNKEWIAIVVSVCLQTGYHLYQGVYATLLISSQFFVYALFYARYRRASPIILAHFYFDVLALIANR